MDKDGMTFIRFTDYEFLSETFRVHRNAHPLAEGKVSCHPTFVGFPANLAEPKQKSADQ